MNNPANDAATAARTKTLPIDDAIDAVHSALSRADTERARAYEELEVFRRAKANLLTRHEKLLELKLGYDAPRVVAIRAQRSVIDAQLRDLQVATTVASTPMPEPSASGFIVHGFIRDTNLQPIPQAVLTLYGASGKPRADFRPAVADQRGYFSLETRQLNQAGVTGASEGAASGRSPALELRAVRGPRNPTLIARVAIDPAVGESRFVNLVAMPIESTPTKAEVPPRDPATPTKDLRAGIKAMSAELRRKTTERRSHSAQPTKTRTSVKPVDAQVKRRAAVRKTKKK